MYNNKLTIVKHTFLAVYIKNFFRLSRIVTAGLLDFSQKMALKKKPDF